ncbi:hypothetical protein AHiyo4_06930 [Arthrobacter sp. Hiyo4]|nr:hypothetical protein AHiyo4_06930 [Arthrobacter sp. Hiyo4]
MFAPVNPVARTSGHPPDGHASRVEDGHPASWAQVGFQQLLGIGHQGPEVVDSRDRSRRMQTGQEAGLAAVDVADARQVALVQQGDADGHVGCHTDPPLRFGRVPVRTQQVRTQVAHDAVLVRGADHFQDAKRESDGVRCRRAQNAPGGESRLPPAPSGRIDLPGAFHLQVRMDGEFPLLRSIPVRAQHAHQEVLAAGDNLRHGPAGQVERGEPRHAEVRCR